VKRHETTDRRRRSGTPSGGPEWDWESGLIFSLNILHMKKAVDNLICFFILTLFLARYGRLLSRSATLVVLGANSQMGGMRQLHYIAWRMSVAGSLGKSKKIPEGR
jgi:hypothetical protein